MPHKTTNKPTKQPGTYQRSKRRLCQKSKKPPNPNQGHTKPQHSGSRRAQTHPRRAKYTCVMTASQDERARGLSRLRTTNKRTKEQKHKHAAVPNSNNNSNSNQTSRRNNIRFDLDWYATTTTCSVDYYHTSTWNYKISPTCCAAGATERKEDIEESLYHHIHSQ